MIQPKPILEGKECSHQNCREVCHRKYKEKIFTPIKRTPLKKSFTPIKKRSKNELPDLIDKLDRLVSEFVRRNGADKEGVNSCFTCGSRKHWRYLQNGHFVNRDCMLLRFSLDNCRPQCAGCNSLNYGRLYEYAENLNKEQEGLPTLLLRLSKSVHSWSRSELEEMIDDFKLKIKSLPKL